MEKTVSRQGGTVDRRTFLQGAAAVTGAATFAAPLQALARGGVKNSLLDTRGYGRLVNMGDLSLPKGFDYRVISRAGDRMSDGNPTPSAFDAMAAFAGADGNVVLIRNHENRASTGDLGEIDVIVPRSKRYDPDPIFNGGNTKVVVDRHQRVVRDFAIQGGTTTNCAGGVTPWGTWVSCEEVFQDGEKPHGYIFEIPAHASGPVDAVPVKSAGRFVHEAVAWHKGILYQTEDQTFDSAFYRYVPEQTQCQQAAGIHDRQTPGSQVSGCGERQYGRMARR